MSTAEFDRLIQAARKATQRAYAPFSKFRVGAAVLTHSGQVFTGCNVENSSYGLTNCAERSAIFTAVGAGADEGNLEVKAVAVFNADGVPCAPCGACRQVIFEFGPEAVVIYAGHDGAIHETSIRELLPEGFRLR
jgi:cytidine deaminase